MCYQINSHHLYYAEGRSTSVMCMNNFLADGQAEAETNKQTSVKYNNIMQCYGFLLLIKLTFILTYLLYSL